MEKINYNSHDWRKGETVTENNLDNMENGIKQATNKINEIIDTEQDFKNRMADIDERIDINNEELIIARDGCDNLGQRIERDQQYIYNILNDGSYLEFNGTDITVDNSKEGYTSNMLIKGQTYQNLVKEGQEETTLVSDSTNKGIQSKSIVLAQLLKINTTYTFIYNVEQCNLTNGFSVGGNFDSFYDFRLSKNLGINKVKFTTKDTLSTSTNFVLYIHNDTTNNSITINNFIILEGDYTNKEVPSSITGIESVGEKENNKISILSHGKNLFNMENLVTRGSATILNRTATSITITTLGEWSGVHVVGCSLKPNTTYRLKYDATHEKTRGYIRFRDTDGQYPVQAYTGGSNNFKFTTPENNGYALISIETSIPLENITISNIQLKEGLDETEYEPYKEDKKEILIGLDGGLKSLPNGVADTIEQRENGVYLVQRVGKYNYNGSENWQSLTQESSGLIRALLHQPQIKVNTDMLSNRLQRIYWSDSPWVSENECFSIEGENGGTSHKLAFYLKCDNNIDAFKQNLRDNPVTIYYELDTPIETKFDIDTINLQTFKDVTYVTSGNSIKPTLSFKAPVDVNQTIADLQEEQEQLIETYNTLKEENETVKMAISELNEQEDVQTADMLDLDMRVLALEEGLE